MLSSMRSIRCLSMRHVHLLSFLGQSGKSTRLYEACDILATQMKRGEDVPEYSKMDAIMGIVQDETGDFIVWETGIADLRRMV